MPRRNSPHPSLRRQPEQPLQHGDEFPHDDQFDEDEEEQEEDPDFSAERKKAAEPNSELEQLRRELELNRREIEDLRRRTPVEPAVRNQPEAEEEPDWDELLFKDPKAAMKLHGERVAKSVREELRREYAQDQGTNQFWSDFYKDHPDLEGDDDLVQTMLNSNLAKLGGMPVKKAMDELADLTRQRIMRYSNGKGRRPGNRAVAEGASAPRPGRPAPAADKVVTLSDIIRNRKAKRHKAASAA